MQSFCQMMASLLVSSTCTICKQMTGKVGLYKFQDILTRDPDLTHGMLSGSQPIGARCLKRWWQISLAHGRICCQHYCMLLHAAKPSAA